MAERILEKEFSTLTSEGRTAALDRAYEDNLWSADGVISPEAVNMTMTVRQASGLYEGTWDYAKMVDMLKIIGERLDVGVIDLYTDKEFNNISDEQRELYMADPIHPTKAGYLKWWTPKMEEYLYEFVSEKVD